jgi:hypothetical protein
MFSIKKQERNERCVLSRPAAPRLACMTDSQIVLTGLQKWQSLSKRGSVRACKPKMMRNILSLRHPLDRPDPRILRKGMHGAPTGLRRLPIGPILSNSAQSRHLENMGMRCIASSWRDAVGCRRQPSRRALCSPGVSTRRPPAGALKELHGYISNVTFVKQDTKVGS